MDPDIADIIEEENDRGVPTDRRVQTLTILEARGEPRWESDRYEDGPTKEEVWADGLMAFDLGEPRVAPANCPRPDSWNGGWDYGHHQNLKENG